ncbi:MAG: hypothetical protein GDA47_04430 [Rhodospirillales bacterium]|nr:hypothetical protein [Rhodospirillales bacterium]
MKQIIHPKSMGPDPSHEAINQSSGVRVRGELHIQNVNNRHSGLKGFIARRKGIATKYLSSDLSCFHLIVQEKDPTPRLSLASTIGGMRINNI